MSRSRKVVLGSFFALCVYLSGEAFLPVACQPSARISVAVLHAYQATGSRAMEACGVQCRYRPSCSHYAVDAISYYGTLDGVLRTAGRLWRCSPWGGSGYDPAVEPHSAAYLAPQETPEEKKQREESERQAAEQIRRVQENLGKPADKAAMDELNRAVREGMRNAAKGQAAAPQNETDEQRQKRENREAKEEAEKLGRELGMGCAKSGAACAVFLVIGLVYLAVKIFIMVWAFKDAKARGDQNAILWPILIFFLSIVGLVIYLAVRPKGDFSPCGSCHQKRLSTLTKCPHCSVDSAAPPPKPPSA
jgi:hypothetical protein